jgi:putative membrane protein
MSILLFKAIHIVGFVAWFAGLFYLVRIFVYHVEALGKSEPEASILKNQFKIMESRVYKIICNPAMIITWIAGLAMIHLYGLDWLKENSWMHTKLLLLTILTGYHHWCGRQVKKFDKDQIQTSSYKMRLVNEIPTLFLFAIVFLATYRNLMEAGKIFGGILVLGILLFIGVRMYRKMRLNSKN